MDGGATFDSDVAVGDTIEILIILELESADIGFDSELYVIAEAGPNYLLVTPGDLLPWDGSIGNLVAFDEITLSVRLSYPL